MENLIHKLRQNNITVELVGDQLKLEVPEDFEGDDILAEVRERKQALITYIKNVKGGAEFQSIVPALVKDSYALSSAQNRLYFLYEFDKRSTAYNMPYVAELAGNLDETRLKDALIALVGRHESLRTYFEVLNGTPVQKVMNEVYFDLERYSLEEGKVDDIIDEFVRPFDLSKAPLIRVGLLRLSSKKQLLLFDMHHIISDGTSQSILVKDFMALYDHQELEELPLQYKDFSEWQKGDENQSLIEKQRSFWLNQFQELPPMLELPTDFPRTVSNPADGNTISFHLSNEQTQRLKLIASQEGTTLFMVVLAIYNILLSKLSREEDITIGTSLAGREHEGLDTIVGMFVNTMVLRNYPHGTLTFVEFLKRLKGTTLSCFDNQGFQYEELIENLQMVRDSSRNPLFDANFSFQNFEETTLSIPGLTLTPYKHQKIVSKVDIGLVATETKDGLFLNFEYATNLFKAQTIERFVTYFDNIVTAVIADREIVLSEINVLSDKEKLWLTSLNATATSGVDGNTMVDLFENQVLETPQAVVTIYGNRKYTYAEFNKKANQLARHLRSTKRIKADDVIGVLMTKSDDFLLTILAILKSGAAYLPIDSSYPQDRIAHIIKDSRLKLLISKKEHSNLGNCKKTVFLENLDLSTKRDSNLNIKVSPNDLAYVIYTSGSTGLPKGVMIEHKGNVNMSIDQINAYSITAKDKVLWFASVGFDVSVLEISLALFSGATLAIPQEGIVKDKHEFAHFLNRVGVTVAAIPPTYMDLLELEDLSSLRSIVTGGEASRVEKAIEIVRSGINYFNSYGPTECSVCVAGHQFLNKGNNITGIPIGRPISNTKVYLLDRDLKQVPMGVQGTLYVSGTGVARGYMHQPELTKERFIAAPWNKDERLYNTGDIACWNANGNLEFKGRQDEQVKIRGHRIELGEIVASLENNDSVTQAVVIVKESASLSYKELVAYVVPNQSFDQESLKTALGKQLPGYMVPSYIMAMTTIPLTPNGKVDKRRLPEPEISGTYEPPCTNDEQLMVEVWGELLRLEAQKIGVTTNFFSIGGHSLNTIGLVNKIAKMFEVNVPVKEVFIHNTIRSLCGYIAGLKKIAYAPIVPTEKKDYYDLSSAQKRLYFMYEFDKTTLAYNAPQIIKLTGNLDVKRLQAAFLGLVERHESLRTSFEMVDDKPVQSITDELSFELEHYTTDTETTESIIERFIRPFDLSSGRLIRVGLIKIATKEHLLLLDMHHIITDGESSGILVRDFMKLYNRETLPELVLQYKDFAEWQQQGKQQENISEQRQFWLEQFEETPTILDLPNDYPRPLVKSEKGNEISFVLDQADTAKLNQIAEEEGATLFMVILAIYNVLLSRLSGEEDIVVGTSIAGRQHADLEGMVGMFVNTLVLRNYPKGRHSFKHFLKALKENTLACFDNQGFQYEELIDELKLSGNTSRNPLFDAHFTFQNFETTTLAIEGLTLTPYDSPLNISKFDLELLVFEKENELVLNFDYATSLFKEETIERFIGYFREIVSGISKDRNIELAQINLLSQKEQNQLDAFNDTTIAYPENSTIVDLFEAQVAQNPNTTAVLYGNRSYSYDELNQRVNQLAHYLRKNYQVRADDVIGLLLPKSDETLIAILAVLKAGGAYLPIDPDYPMDRIEYILENSGSKLLITTTGQNVKTKAMETIYLDALDVAKELTTNLSMPIAPNDLAYVIYTSGSTGMPKGVMVEHTSNVNMSPDQIRTYRVTKNDTVTWFASIAFDASVFEIMMALYSGACLAIPEEGIIKDKERFVTFLKEKKVTLTTFPPTYLDLLSAEDVSGLRCIITAGEAARVNKATEMIQAGIEYYNAYGPTECAVCVSTYRFSEADIGSVNVPIGKPISNTRLYILDDNLLPVPIGSKGSLYASGAGLARGYLNNEMLTKERFVINPGNASERLYQTGDIARWRTDGNLEFLGRNDDQIKIRGHRIELGEVTATLESLPSVKQAVVLNHNDNLNETIKLIAYIVPETRFDVDDLKHALAKTLPEYMIPAYFMELSEFPLTTNGKVDKKNLPELVFDDHQEAPATSIEKRMLPIWSEVLKIEESMIGSTKSFFEIGGNSLSAIGLINKLSKAFDVKIPLEEVFSNPTIKSLGAFIAHSANTHHTAIPIAGKKDYYPLSSAQKRMYFLYEFDKESVAYNMPNIVRLAGDVDFAVLENAFVQLIARHESLRTYFDFEADTPVQKISSDAHFEVTRYEAADSDTADQIVRSFVRPFDLSKAPLIRVGIITWAPEEHILILDMHHIVTDGVSQAILVKDFMQLYEGKVLPELTLNYKDYASWQQGTLNEHAISEQRAFWLDQYKEEPPSLELPTDFPRPVVKNDAGDSVPFTIGKKETESLKNIAEQEGGTLFMILLAVYNVLLGKLSGEEDIVVGTPIAGRQHSDVEQMVGLFINTLALRNAPLGTLGFHEFLRQLKANTISCFDQQGLQFEELIDELQLRRDTSRNTLFDAMFTFQNMAENEIAIQGLALSPYESNTTISKFDLDLSASEANGQLFLNFDFATSLFKRETIKRFIGYFKQIVTTIVATPEVKIASIDILQEQEKQQLFNCFNQNKADFPLHNTIIDLFEEQVAKTPDNVAVIFENYQLTYRQLNEEANKIAHALRSDYHIKPDDKVALLMERSEQMIIALLGVLKSGAAYVPINLDFPKAKRRYILENSEARLLLVDEAGSRPNTFDFDVPVLAIEDIKVEMTDNLRKINSSKDLAYVIYTSGSTGKSKGVMIEHHSLVNLAKHMIDFYDMDQTDGVLQFAPLSFDMSVEEIFPALICGAKLYVRTEEIINTTEDFLAICSSHSITVLNLPTAFWKHLTQEIERLAISFPECVRILAVGGEALTVETTRNWLKAHGDYPQLVNAYGPTEVTVNTCMYRITEKYMKQDMVQSVPIGTPVTNLAVYITNTFLKAVPIGVIGEICVSGPGVARGYLNNEILSAEKFVANPFKEGERMYRTGDLGRWLPNGTIEFLGRKDDQVKIRGYRVELGEIQTALESLKMVRQAVVLVREDLGDGKQLVAYFTTGNDFDLNVVKDGLKEMLPDYMIPQHYVELDTIPLNSSGKIYKQGLPMPSLTEMKGTSYKRAATDEQQQLVDIWQSLLQIERVGITDNFFELGGDSIKAIQLMSRARAVDIHFKVKDLFRYQTILELSKNLQSTTEVLVEEGILTGEVGLLPIQKEFFESGYANQNHYNQSILLDIPAEVGITQVSEAITMLVEQHDSMRLRYNFTGDRVVQQYHADMPTLVQEKTTKKRSVEAICQDYQESLDLKSGETCRFVYIQTGSATDRLFIAVHHLSIDGISWRILLEDLETIFDHLRKGEKPKLPPKSTSYRQWYDRLLDHKNIIEKTSEIDYWKQVVSQDVYFPVDYPSKGSTRFEDLSQYDQELTKSSTKKLLQGINHAYGTEINDVLLSGLAQALTNWSGTDEVIIALEGHGREELFDDIDISRTTGWFTSMYPVRLKRCSDVGAQLMETKDMLRDVPNKGIGYGLLRYLDGNTGLQNALSKPYATIEFNYLGSFDNSLNEDSELCISKDARGTDIAPQNQSPSSISINSMVVGGKLNTSWSYDAKKYKKATIEKLAADYEVSLLAIIEHCTSKEPRKTRSDYALPSTIENMELTAFQKLSKHPSAITDIYPLSPLQKGMLFHSLYEQGKMSYISHFSYDFMEGVRGDLFEQSWSYLMQQHNILRTAIFPDYFNVPVQCVYDKVVLPMVELDYSDLRPEELTELLDAYIATEMKDGFDLEQAPLLKFILIRLPEGRTRLVLKSHHILWDGWSLAILMGQFVMCYDHLLKGLELPAIHASNYGRFVRYIASKEATGSEAHWKSYLQDLQSPVYLPFVKDKNKRNKVFGNTCRWSHYDEGLVNGLMTFAQRHRLTMNTLVQGAWSYLLARYTGLSNVVFGATVSGRDCDLGHIEEEVGLYINTLPVCSRVDFDADLGSWLKELQEQHTRGREEYSYVSLSDLQGWTSIQGELFDSLLVFENYPVDEELLGSSSLSLENVIGDEFTNYVLTMGVSHMGDELSIKFDYNDTLLPSEMVKNLQAHLLEIFKSMAQGVDKVGNLVYMGAKERECIVDGFNDTTERHTEFQTMVTAFEKQVAKTPDRIAVTFKGNHFTYAQLNARANQLAAYLKRSFKIGTDDIIGVLLPKSYDALVSILGILKAGAAYLPIDPEYPVERIDHILEDSRARVLLTNGDKIDLRSHKNTVLIDDLNLDKEEGVNVNTKISTSDLAYVIYTSGSTGKPKGVMIEHASNVNMSLDQIKTFKVSVEDTILWFASIAFDASVSEIMMALYSGATLAIPEEHDIKDKEKFIAFLSDSGTTVSTFPPTYLDLLSMTDIAGIRCVITAGEAARPQKAMEVVKSGKEYYNAYGPTECAVCVSTYEATLADIEEVIIPIGSPIKNMQLYVLDELMEPVAIGVTGTLYASGIGVARGYLNNSELTEERFVSAPWNDKIRMYNTGDMARWKLDGTLEFLGRTDNQVKIRGHRIELGEVETVLEQVSIVKQAVVLVKEDEDNTKELIAYVVPETRFERDAIVSTLNTKLPEYMIPSYFMEINEIPLTTNGKVDKKALPELDVSGTYQAPRTEMERRMVRIWSELLHVEQDQIGVATSFFEVGGHSLNAISLINQIAKEFDAKIPLEEVFSNETITELCELIEASVKVDYIAIEPAAEKEFYALSHAQQRMYFLYEFDKGSLAYNMPQVMKIMENVAVKDLETAFSKLIDRHESLRTSFVLEKEVPMQRIHDKVSFEIEYSKASLEAIDRIVQAFVRPFDLSNGPLFRVGLVEISAEEYFLLIDMHHIVTDGISSGILINDFIRLYSGETLPASKLQYKDYAAWQQNEKNQIGIAEQRDFWLEKFREKPLALDLPTDFVRPLIRDNRGGAINFEINSEDTARLKAITEEEGVTLFMLLLAVFNVFLSKLSNQDDIVIGTPVGGREHTDLENIVGMFVNTLVLRNRPKGKLKFTEFLQELKTDTVSCFNHQDFQYEALVDSLQVVRDTGRNALFDVLFTLNTAEESKSEVPGLKLTAHHSETKVSKFDLELSAIEAGGQLFLSFDYATSLFEKETIERFIGYFKMVIAAIIQNKDGRLSDIQILSPEESVVLSNFSSGELASNDFAEEATLLDFLGDVTSSHGSSLAVWGSNLELTYDALWNRSNALASYLINELDVAEGASIAVYMDRSPLLVIAMLGIWKAGCTYVPIDVSHPTARLRGIIEDSNAVTVLSETMIKGIDVPVVDITRLPLDLVATLSPKPISAGDLAYILYTSGTTGRPKGVQVTHGNLYAYLKGIEDRFMKGGVQAVLSSNSFDIFHFELLRPLLGGGQALLVNNSEVRDMDVLLSVLKKANSFHAVPALMSAIVDTILEIGAAQHFDIKEVYTGGDRVPRQTLSRMREAFPEAALYEFYGPTEGTIFVTVREYKTGELMHNGVTTIGSPMGHNSVLVLDSAGYPCPIGVPGELHIGGPQVTLGYLGLAAVTASRFIDSPFENGKKLYATGDLAKWLPNGQLVFLGRNDRQLKVRGYRIEPGEVERVLEAHESVGQAVVAAQELNGSVQLLAYVVPAGEELPDRSVLSKHLEGQLPSYMVPRDYIELVSFPLTANDKIDYGALPLPNSITENEYTPPTNPTEEKLTTVWEGILGKSPIGITENFFELGGDSIKAIQLMGRARTHDIHFKVKDLFEHQTIKELASNLDTAVAISREEGLLTGGVGLLPIQQEFFATRHPEAQHYNQSVLLTVPKEVTINMLSSAVDRLVSYHDALRFQYDFSGPTPIQTYSGMVPSIIQESPTDDRGLDLICQEYQSSLAPDKGVVCYFVYMPLNSDEGRLLIVAHHLCIDGVSWRVLLDDLDTLLKGFLAKSAQELPPKGTSYRQWQSLLASRAKRLEASQEAAYWKELLASNTAVPVDREVNTPSTYKDIDAHRAVLSKETTEELLHGTHRAYGTEINDLLLSALGEALTEWSDREEVLIHLEGHGREELFEQADVSRTVGWFTSGYPVRLKRYKELSDQLMETKDMLADIPNRGMGYGLLRYLSDTVLEERDAPIVFNYLGSFDNSFGDSSILGHAPESRGEEISLSNFAGAAISINGMVVGGELHTEWSFDRRRYDVETIAKLAMRYQDALESIVAHCRDRERTITRGDHGLPATVANRELQLFLEETKTVSKVYPLSPLQEGMLFHSLYAEGRLPYVSQFTCDFPEGLDMDRFGTVWSHLIKCHDVLRTSVHADRFEIPVQCVHEEAPVRLVEVDYRHLEGAALEQALASFAKSEATQSFDLTAAPLFGFSVVRLPGGTARLTMRNHHILWDGWSLSILMGQFMSCYAALAQGNTLPKIPESNYGKFIRQVRAKGREGAERFWRTYLRNLEGPTHLPFLEARQQRNKLFGNTFQRMQIDAQLTRDLVSYAQQHRLTMNTMVQGAWSYLLSRYSGVSEIVFGATVSGRDWGVGKAEEEVGLYINTLPVCTKISPEQEIGSWLSELQDGHTKGREDYAYVSLAEIQGWIGMQDSLFDSLLVFENYPVDEAMSNASTAISIDNVKATESTNYLLTLGISHTGDDLSIKFDYNDQLLSYDTVTMVQGHLLAVLRSMISEATRVGDLDFLDEKETSLLLAGFGTTDMDAKELSDSHTVLDLITAQVRSTPGSPALSCADGQLSYDDLSWRSDIIAYHLQSVYKINKGDKIVVYMDRCLDMVAAMIGIWKAGGVYVPVDVSQPLERLDYILGDTASAIVLSNSAISAKGLSGLGSLIVDMDKIPQSVPDGISRSLEACPQGQDLAYVLYTSGTTGVPKGVMVKHSNLLAYLKGIEGRFIKGGVQPILSSNSFDIFLFELFRPLLTGGTACLLTDEEIRDMDLLLERIKEANSFHAVPAFMSTITESIGQAKEKSVYTNIKELYIGGDAVPIQILIRMREVFPCARIHEFYGPTEGTIFAVSKTHGLDDEIGNIATIGSPIGYNSIRILDAAGKLCARGVVGEIHIGGAQVSQGYLNLPSVTDEKYVESVLPGREVLFRTGDMGKWLPNGNIAFIGRNDRQVKIRGYRIELGEIEKVLEGLPSVERAVLTAADLGSGKRLVAYVVPAPGIVFDRNELMGPLRNILPDYMVPRYYTALSEIPLTTNGKVDHEGLPEPIIGIDDNYVAPKTDIERQLVSIWSELLAIDEEHIGITESFFNLGGDSLKTITLQNKIKKDFDIKIKLEAFFNEPSIKELGRILLVSSLSVDNTKTEEKAKITI